MSHRAALLPLAAPLLLLTLVAGCGKANPVAPSGSTLTLHVNPTTIPSARGSATATATLIRPNGTPDNGAQVQFTTTLGTFNPTAAATKSDGNAVSTLSGNGTAGTAKVTAFSGGVMSTELDVTIGSLGASITLQASPATLPAALPPGGAKVTLVAVVRDATGLPQAGEQVNFTTTVGTLKNNGLVPTDANGTATDILTVKPTDLTSQTSIMVEADTANSMGAIQNAKFSIAILTNAAATIVVSGSPTTLPKSGGTVNLSALVRDSIGNVVPNVGVSFVTTLGTLSSGTSQGSIKTTDANGNVSDTLTVPPQTGGASGMVTASAAGAGGSLVTSNTLTITVNAQ
jgi:adhesin/invasin